jgi:hypothetical protein
MNAADRSTSIRQSLLRGGAVLAVATLLSGAAVAATADAALAVGGTCSATTENVSLTGPDGKRVKASCSKLEGDSKARGTLDLVAASDKHTAWFTGLNTAYRSDYDRGPNRGSYYTIAHV